MKKWMIIILYILNNKIYALNNHIKIDSKNKIYYKKLEKNDRESFVSLFNEVYQINAQDIPFEELQQRLWEKYNNPLPLNNSTGEELRNLGILNDSQIENIISHIYINGPLISIYELQTLSKFDSKTIYLLTHFVKVNEVLYRGTLSSLERKLLKKTSWVQIKYERNLEKRKGYKVDTKNPYLGSPDKFVGKIKINIPKKFRAGVIGTKSPGEQFIWDHDTYRYGFNFISAYTEIQNISILKSALIGDYQIGCGQGLVSSSGFHMNKNQNVIPIMKSNNNGIRPYSSTINSNFLRGIASTITYKDFNLTLYFSNLNHNASIRSINNDNYVSSIRSDLKYRTQNEIEKKDKLNEKIGGFCINYKNEYKNREIGIMTMFQKYNLSINPAMQSDLEEIDNIEDEDGQFIKTDNKFFKFHGNKCLNSSVFGNYVYKNVYFFSETAFSYGKQTKNDFATINGVMIALGKKIDFSFLTRHFGSYFHSIRGDAFREFTSEKNRNEQGIYTGFTIKPFKKIIFNTYIDLFRFPAPRHNVPKKGSKGFEWIFGISFIPNKIQLITLLFKQKAKQKWSKEYNNLILPLKSTLKINYKHQFSRFFSTKTELQATFFKKINDNLKFGEAISQSMSYKIRSSAFKTGITLFGVGKKFENDVYIYESKFLYDSTFPTNFTSSGQKIFFLFMYKTNFNLRIELKYDVTRYNNKYKIHQNKDEIEGNFENKISAQLVYYL